MPWVLSRWPARSSWVQLARSGPCSAGPAITQLLTSSARDTGMWPGLPAAFLGRCPIGSVGAVGVEPPGDGASVNPQVGGDALSGAAAVGHEYDLEPVPELTVRRRAEQDFEAFRLGRRQLDANQGEVSNRGASLSTHRARSPLSSRAVEMCLASANRVRGVVGFFGPRTAFRYRLRFAPRASPTNHSAIRPTTRRSRPTSRPGSRSTAPGTPPDTSSARW